MKKIMILIFTLLLLSGYVSARQEEASSISFFGGITSLSMEAVNANMPATFWSTEEDIKTFGGGYVAGVDLAFEFMPGISIGPRAEYIGAFDASAAERYILNTVEHTYSASIIPVMLGMQAVYRESRSPFALGLGLFWGYGFANFKDTADTVITATGATTTTTVVRTGGGEAAELFLRMDYEVEDLMTLGIFAGYRKANAIHMKATEATESLSTDIGDEWLSGGTGEPMVVSFNGWYFDLGLVFKF